MSLLDLAIQQERAGPCFDATLKIGRGRGKMPRLQYMISREGGKGISLLRYMVSGEGGAGCPTYGMSIFYFASRYPSAFSNSAKSSWPPAAPRTVLWLRATNL